MILSTRVYKLVFNLLVSGNSVILVLVCTIWECLEALFNPLLIKCWTDARVDSSQPVSFSVSIWQGMKFLSNRYYSVGSLALILSKRSVTSSEQASYCASFFVLVLCFSICIAISIIYSYVWFNKKSKLFKGDGFLSLNRFKSRFCIIRNCTVLVSNILNNLLYSARTSKCSSIASNNSFRGICWSYYNISNISLPAPLASKR